MLECLRPSLHLGPQLDAMHVVQLWQPSSVLQQALAGLFFLSVAEVMILLTWQFVMILLIWHELAVMA